VPTFGLQKDPDRHGLRASEVCGLTFADIDLKNASIAVSRLKGSLRTIQPFYQHRGQPLLDELFALRTWLRVRPYGGGGAVGDDGGILMKILNQCRHFVEG